MYQMTPEQKAYVSLYAARLRKSNRKATEAANKWEARKKWLTEVYGPQRGYNLKGKDFRDLCTHDWKLIDAMDEWSWHEREAKRCLAAIQGLALEMNLLYGRKFAAPDMPEQRQEAA